MNLKKLKPTLFKLHRWIGIGLAPLFLLIALSGSLLAFKPTQPHTPDLANEGAPLPQLIALLQKLDPLGQEVDGLMVDAAAEQVTIRSHNPQLQGQYGLDNAIRLDGVTEEESFDLFEFAEHLHKDLLIGADILIQIASYLMVLIIVVAPFLAWPHLRNNLMGWHRGAGWLLLPLVLMLPLTGVLMSLHLGMPELPRMSQPGLALSLQEGLQKAQQEFKLEKVTMIQRFRGGSVMLRTQQPGNEKMLIVTDQAVVPLEPHGSLVKTLHEGTWAGAWSSALNLLGAAALSLLSVSGLISWLRKRKRRKQRLNERTGNAAA
jgi:sulfite reductase (NADPH) flavoprotein alpha-component